MKKLLGLAVVLIFLVGCVDNTRTAQDMNDIKDQLWKIQAAQSEQLKKLKELEEQVNKEESTNETQADIITSQQEIQENISVILERIRDLNEKMTYILAKLSALQTGNSSQPSNNNDATQNGGVAADISSNPDALFSQAYTDYIKGNYDMAIIEFKDYIANYSSSEKVDNAYYWLGMCYFEKENYRDAKEMFDKILKDYPQSDVLAAAMLKKGLALLEMGSTGMAVVQLQELIEKFPLSKEAALARKKLDALHVAN